MKSHINERFLSLLRELPDHVKQQARKAYQLFQEDPTHPSLQFKLVNAKERLYSVRISRRYRALGFMEDGEIIWFWIGTHSEYDRLLARFGN